MRSSKLLEKNNVLCFVEHHKRSVVVLNVKVQELSYLLLLPLGLTPCDAKAKAATLGEFNFFNAWMSQPKSQLNTYRAWAGKDSDIRYHY